MTTDLFVVSYRKDFPWLKNLLRSISERCTGFRRTNIVVPMKDLDAIHGFGLTKELVIGFSEPNIRGDSIQQCLKLTADTYTDADFIVFLDSDVFLTKPFSPDFMFRQGKPLVYMTEHAKIQTHWKAGMDHVFKRDTKYEYMRRFPLGYPRWLLRSLRDWFEKEHGADFWTYYSEKRYPHAMSEFNMMGAYAHFFFPTKFTFVDTAVEQPCDPILIQFWSHGGAGHPLNSELLLKHGLTLT